MTTEAQRRPPGEHAGKVIECRGCGRQVKQTEATFVEGHPHGWFNLTVNCPRWFNADSGKPYRWLGTFCSIDCLIGHEATLRQQQELMVGVYEHE